MLDITEGQFKNKTVTILRLKKSRKYNTSTKKKNNVIQKSANKCYKRNTKCRMNLVCKGKGLRKQKKMFLLKKGSEAGKCRRGFA